MESTPVLNLVSIDYIRLATFDFQAYCELSARMRRKFTGWRKSRWLQYKMERSKDGVAYGLAEQDKRPHGIFESSGIDAHVFTTWLIETQKDILDELYASRIDLQATKARPDGLDYVKCHKRLTKPKKLILGDEGNTLYIGNRKSDSFVRIYDKTLEHTRVEIELKGHQGKKVWRAILGGKSPTQLYEYYLSKSRVPKFLVDYFLMGNRDPIDDDELKLVVPEDLERKFQWLCQLDGLVYKLANDHDLAERTHVLLKRWEEYCSKD